MPRECVWFDSFDVEVSDQMVIFTGHSDGEVLTSRVRRNTAATFAYDILDAIERADMAETTGVILPFGDRAH